jgi:hypothetical protein
MASRGEAAIVHATTSQMICVMSATLSFFLRPVFPPSSTSRSHVDASSSPAALSSMD